MTGVPCPVSAGATEQCWAGACPYQGAYEHQDPPAPWWGTYCADGWENAVEPSAQTQTTEC